MRLLLVEDDFALGDGIQTGLKQQGFTVDWVQSAEDAELSVQMQDHKQATDSPTYCAIVLDVHLPGMSGIEFLKRLRSKQFSIPVIILTSLDSVQNRVAGLNLGADDYLTKPFSLIELAARIHAITRRSRDHSSSIIQHGALALDPSTQRVTLREKIIELSPKEFAILAVLVTQSGKALSKHQLETALYGWNEEIESNAIEVHINRSNT